MQKTPPPEAAESRRNAHSEQPISSIQKTIGFCMRTSIGWLPSMQEQAMTKRAAIYLRVSTAGQTVENQRHELEQMAVRRGWTVAAIYEDAGISGAKGRDQRPGFDRMLKDASRHKFDV